MAIEDIFKALDEQAENECKDVLEAAKEQAKGIAADADDEAENIKSHKLEQVRGAVDSRAARLINAARLQNRKDVAGVKDEAIEDVYAKALDGLAALRKQGSYEKLFAALAAEAVAGLEGPVVMQVDPADAKLAEKTAKALGFSATIDTSVPVIGGLTVIANDGRIIRRNTFPDRLGKVRKTAQATISETLFS